MKMDLIGLIGVISSDPPFLGTCQDSWQYFSSCYLSIPTTSTTFAGKNISDRKLELEARNQMRCGGQKDEGVENFTDKGERLRALT